MSQPKRLHGEPGRSKVKKECSEESFAAVTSTPMTLEYQNKIAQELRSLRKFLLEWSIMNGGKNYSMNDREMLQDYLRCHHEYYEFNQFDSEFELLPLLNINHERIRNVDLIYKSWNCFKQAIWPIRFGSRFIAKLNGYYYNQIMYILGFVGLLAAGKFISQAYKGHDAPIKYGTVVAITTKSLPLNRFFICKIFREKNILVQIGVEEVPVIKLGIIKRYEFRNYINFLDVLDDACYNGSNKLQERLTIFRDYLLNDVAKTDHSSEVQFDTARYNPKSHCYFFSQADNPYTGRLQTYQSSFSRTDLVVWMPLPFKPYYFSPSEAKSLIFDQTQKRWLNKDVMDRLERKKVKEFQQKVNSELIKAFVDFQSAKVLVELLTKIPNFKIRLTEQEKDVIGQNGNILAIGRSGTGKTTCAVLRLFAIEMLFKIRMSLYKKKYGEGIKVCDSSDIDQTLGLHCIFLTASPVLTHEIQRYYKKLTDNIKQELDKKRQKVQAQQRLQEQEQQAKHSEQSNTSMVEIEDDVAPQKLSKRSSSRSAEDLEEERAHMEEELEGIIVPEEVEEQEEDMEELKQKFQENVKKFQSLDDLTPEDYPGFFTVKSFIMMIDGVLMKPFFIRNNSVIVEQQSKAAWHNEKKGVMMIENYYRGDQAQPQDYEDIEEEVNFSDEEELQHQYMRQIQLKENKEKQHLTHKLKKKAKTGLSFEVDYEYFLIHFWPNVQRRFYSTRNITAHLVWTEIYSTIKGSAGSHLYPGQYLSQMAYMTASSNTFLTKEEKLDIYEAFCQYERWKINNGGYDLMDTVNYILNYTRFRGFDGPQLHYIMIDEVQDLPHAVVYLLSKVASYGVFYSGDTAQTIAKGVGFRFCDLKSLFNPHVFDQSLKMKTPVVKHLTINFRSHNDILQLANSVVSSIQILFPKTIDRMKKEVSNLSGPKPMILAQGDEEMLFYVLCGGEKQEQKEGLRKPPLEFGCQQVIIVRDQDSKAKVPVMLQHALCLTIYEAKGLEFNDVILFNFFSETKCPEKWTLLKLLEVIEVEMNREDYDRTITKHTAEEQQQPVEDSQEQVADNFVEFAVEQKENVCKIKRIVANAKKIMKDINDYAELCSELKLLYTAITRPRKTLIIYDTNGAARRTIEHLWQQLGIVELITEEIVRQSKDSQQLKVFEKIVCQTNDEEWRKQGVKMYAWGYYDQAMKCFERSHSKELYLKAQANKLANSSTKRLIQIEAERSSIKEGFYLYKQMSPNELSRLKKQLKKEEAGAYLEYVSAAKIFGQLGLWKQAGQCYFSGKKYSDSKDCFLRVGMHKQAAQSLQMMGKYRQAAEEYELEDEYLKVIECLDMGNDWTGILQKIKKYSSKMMDMERQSLLKKYAALALEELVYEIEFENEDKMQADRPQRVEVIQEQHSHDQQDQSDEELQQKEDEERKPKEQPIISEQHESDIPPKIILEQAPIAQQKPVNQGSQIRELDSFQQLESRDEENGSEIVVLPPPPQDGATQPQSSVPQPVLIPESSESSFADLESSRPQSSFQDLAIKYDQPLGPQIQSIKSLIDPQDLWVRNSISEIPFKLESEYSVMNDEDSLLVKAKIIKTKGNIFIQEEIMRKIVDVVSVVHNSPEFFKQFKGYQSLITVTQRNEKTEKVELQEFEDFDPQLINTILDTLQSFKLFKLCLFVCNRYHLPHKAGRYLTSVGVKYSTNCQSVNSVNPVLLAPSPFRKNELEKGILASVAVHAVLENVNAEFLKIKVTQERGLGIELIQGLILQGIYKKTIFMLEPNESLNVLRNYREYGMYDSVYRQNYSKEKEGFPMHAPTSSVQISYVVVLLKKALLEWQIANRFENVSPRYFKQFPQECSSPIDLPAYLPYCRLLNPAHSSHIQQSLSEQLPSAYSTLQNGQAYQVLDIVSFIGTLLHSEALQSMILPTLSLDAFLELYRCVGLVTHCITKPSLRCAKHILDAILHLHQSTRITSCRSMVFLSGYSFVHRSALVANEFVEKNKSSNNIFAYFFEQDYNLILVKTSRLLKVIHKKWSHALVKFYRNKLEVPLPVFSYLHEEHQLQSETKLLRRALQRQIEVIMPEKSKKKVPLLKGKSVKPSLNFQAHSNQEYAILAEENYSSDSEQAVAENANLRTERFWPSFNPRMQNLLPVMLQLFYKDLNADNPQSSPELFGSGANAVYREYVQRFKGYNLYDAVQFKKHKRFDLYSQNILSVINDLSLCDQHCLTEELLVLALVQIKCAVEPEFSLKVPTTVLKHFEGLKCPDYSIDELHNLLALQSLPATFHYEHQYGSNPTSDLEAIILELLQVLHVDSLSQFADFEAVMIFYLINLPSGSEKLVEEMRKIVNSEAYASPTCSFMTGCLSSGEFLKKRVQLLKRMEIDPLEFVGHQVLVRNVGRIELIIEASEIDYEMQTIAIERRRKAANKIGKWWRSVRKQRQEARKAGANNYLQFYVMHNAAEDIRFADMNEEHLAEYRLLQSDHPETFVLLEPYLLFSSLDSKNELLSFYLANQVTSSLDFHFILMTLNDIHQRMHRYISYCQAVTRNTILDAEQLQQLTESAVAIAKNIKTWRSDEKWLRDRNTDLKRKKLFELKWMHKNIGLHKIIKKRAGAKKQEKLQQKRHMIKRTE